MDLMQPVLSALAEALPGARPAAALARERMGAGTGRVHVLGAGRAQSRRRPGALPDRDAPGLPPDGPFRDLHVPPCPEGLLLERLAPAPVARRRADRREPVRARARRRAPLAAGTRVPRRAARARRAGDGVRDAHGERLPAIQAELARARSRRLGLRPPRRDDPRPRRRRRSGDADGEPRRRAGREPVPVHGLAARRRPRRHRGGPRPRTAGRRALPGGPRAAAESPCRRRSTRWRRARSSAASSATSSSTTSSR